MSQTEDRALDYERFKKAVDRVLDYDMEVNKLIDWSQIPRGGCSMSPDSDGPEKFTQAMEAVARANKNDR